MILSEIIAYSRAAWLLLLLLHHYSRVVQVIHHSSPVALVVCTSLKLYIVERRALLLPSHVSRLLSSSGVVHLGIGLVVVLLLCGLTGMEPCSWLLP